MVRVAPLYEPGNASFLPDEGVMSAPARVFTEYSAGVNNRCNLKHSFYVAGSVQGRLLAVHMIVNVNWIGFASGHVPWANFPRLSGPMQIVEVHAVFAFIKPQFSAIGNVIDFADELCICAGDCELNDLPSQRRLHARTAHCGTGILL
jgi:hypothetical protein